MTIQIVTVSSVLLLAAFSQGLMADHQAHSPGLDAWSADRIYHPSEAQLQRESRGQVTIYDGFTDMEVEKALDHGFHRMQSMMFTRVKITKDGQEVIDESTGEAATEDDGCDD
ncbi:hypothetical protein [Thiolapillus sp.]